MFLTMDLEIADRLFPSICSIAIITWEDGKAIKKASSLVFPDCPVEDFFKDRHKITDRELINAPTLPEIWVPLYDMLQGNLVFCHKPNQIIKTLIDRAYLDQLNLPFFRYGSVESICRRTWQKLPNYNLPFIKKVRNILSKDYDAVVDAESIGILIHQSMDYFQVKRIDDLFSAIGFAGGIVKDRKSTRLNSSH